MQQAKIYEDLIAIWAAAETEKPEPAAIVGDAGDDTQPPSHQGRDRQYAAEPRE